MKCTYVTLHNRVNVLQKLASPIFCGPKNITMTMICDILDVDTRTSSSPPMKRSLFYYSTWKLLEYDDDDSDLYHDILISHVHLKSERRALVQTHWRDGVALSHSVCKLPCSQDSESPVLPRDLCVLAVWCRSFAALPCTAVRMGVGLHGQPWLD